MWEAVVGEKVTRADRFIQQLLDLNDGRVAALYDTIGQLDAPHRAFVLGFWIPDAAVRLDRFKALATAGISAYREWHVRMMPFNRSSFDLAMTLGRIAVADNGTPAAPNSRGFWTRVFSGVDVPEDAARQLRSVADEPLDAAWLADTIDRRMSGSAPSASNRWPSVSGCSATSRPPGAIAPTSSSRFAGSRVTGC